MMASNPDEVAQMCENFVNESREGFESFANSELEDEVFFVFLQRVHTGLLSNMDYKKTDPRWRTDEHVQELIGAANRYFRAIDNGQNK